MKYEEIAAVYLRPQASDGSGPTLPGYGADALVPALTRLAERGLVTGEALTDLGRDLRVGIETATDATQADLLAALGPDLDEIVDVVGPWSDRIVAAAAFPSDPYKRAAG